MMASPLPAIVFMSTIVIACAGLAIGLTYAPCYSSYCSEEFYPFATRLHIATFYALLASIGLGLLLRAHSPCCRAISEYSLTKREVPILDKRISIGGLLYAFWIVIITLVTTAFWLTPLEDFWAGRTDPFDWTQAQIRLVVTSIIAHHADIILGLLIIPVSRNSILGRAFALHQSTLLYAHKLTAYLLLVAAVAHGAAAFSWVGIYSGIAESSPIKPAFDVLNPSFTQGATAERGGWPSANLITGVLSFVFMLAIIITALPVLRRRSYNTFYYTHIICSIIIFVGLSLHASTDFYFLLPGLFLWVLDWAWRIFRGDSGLRKKVQGTLQDAGNGWYKITLPASASDAQLKANPYSATKEAGDKVEKAIQSSHPLQSYYLNIPSISTIQNHAFTAAKVGSPASGPVFLFQRAQPIGKAKQKRLDKQWSWKAGHEADQADTKPVPIDVRVEGPYVPAECGFESASHIVCLVGGTGLTGAYSLALWWQAHRASNPKMRFTLIWTIRHRETAEFREWQELEDSFRGLANARLKTHVSSEEGRLDVLKSLKAEFAFDDSTEPQADRKGWVYISGPAGLLSKAEDACFDIERQSKLAEKSKSASGLALGRLDYYVARWEV